MNRHEWRKRKKCFESTSYPANDREVMLDDIQGTHITWDAPVERHSPDILEMLHDLNKRLETLEDAEARK